MLSFGWYISYPLGTLLPEYKGPFVALYAVKQSQVKKHRPFAPA